MIKVSVAPIKPFNPNHSTIPHRLKEAIKPTMPSDIKDLRPRLSDNLAQRGAIVTHNMADQLKARLTHKSDIFRVDEIAGKVECIAVLPAAVIIITMNNKTNLSVEMVELGSVAAVSDVLLFCIALPIIAALYFGDL